MAETAEIWRSFGDALRRFIARRVRDEDAADDVLQEVFVKIHQNLDKLKDESGLQAWLYRITRNVVNDHYRRSARRVEFSGLIEDLPAERMPEPDAAEELGPCVRALMERLPDNSRESLILTEFEGLTQKELGEKLGLSFSGAKSRVQRARGQLKELLLQCCDFQFDGMGGIQEYQARSPDAPDCCNHCGDS